MMAFSVDTVTFIFLVTFYMRYIYYYIYVTVLQTRTRTALDFKRVCEQQPYGIKMITFPCKVCCYKFIVYKQQKVPTHWNLRAGPTVSLVKYSQLFWYIHAKLKSPSSTRQKFKLKLKKTKQIFPVKIWNLTLTNGGRWRWRKHAVYDQ